MNDLVWTFKISKICKKRWKRRSPN